MGFGFLTLTINTGHVFAGEEVKVAFAFQKAGTVECLMAMTVDSVGLLTMDTGEGGSEADGDPDDERSFVDAVNKRAFSPTQKDTAQLILSLTHRWKGLQRFTCSKNDGYAFSVWTDSLALHCNNCFSCTDGISIQDAKGLARLGKLTLWLYRMSEGMPKP
jgi:hypothetical protein